MANQTHQLARLLREEGCNVTVVRANAPCRPAWIGRLRGVRAAFRLIPYLGNLWRTIRNAGIVHVMANSGWSWHLYTAPAVWIGAIHKVPVVVNYRGGDAEAFFSRQFNWVRPTLARARRIVVPSEFLAAVFSKRGIATTIVPNIVNLDAFRPAAVRPGYPHLLVTRNLEPIYDIGCAIRAFAIVAQRYPIARLTIAGSGPCGDQLARLAGELGVNDAVTFVGRLDNFALPDLYRTASVDLNSSRVDNMPISLLEAMASGVPVVSTSVGGVPYLIDDGQTGLLVAAGDHTAMAAAVLRLLDDSEMRTRITANALQAVERFAWSRVRDDLFHCYACAASLT
jgi:glycosyltransferase involved in cell wall biosynthesis